MRSRALLSFFTGLTLGVTPALLVGQGKPIGQPFSVCQHRDLPGRYGCALSSVKALSTGRFVIGTESDERFHYHGDDEIRTYDYCGVGIFDSVGRPVEVYDLESHSLESGRYGLGPAVAPNGAGGFVASWVMGDSPDSYIRALRFLGADATPEQDEGWYVGHAPYPGDDACVGAADVATNAAGQFVIGWRERPCSGWTRTIAVRAYGTAGRPVTSYLRIEPEYPLPDSPFPVMMDGHGRFIVLWEESLSSTGQASRIRGQRYGRDGRLLGTRFSVGGEGTRLAGTAMLADGSFVVGWNENRIAGPQPSIGWFNSSGLLDGAPLEVAGGERLLDLSLDGHGNLALLSSTGNSLHLRLLNRSLVPQGDPIDLPEEFTSVNAGVAMQASGRLLVAGRGDVEYPDPEITVWPVYGQVLQARHDADACSYRSDGFACDTAGDGAGPEQVIAFRALGIPFLADWDGDGRDDPCNYRGGRFACDTAHDGGSAEAEIPAIGRAGDRPLLGDLDGDGKADPCVRRDASFLCDLARDGGAKDLKIDFGLTNDLALLGDPDGDGRDDPCVYRTGRFLCDTAHDGGTAETILSLRRPVPGQPAGTPLLGDLDGDGRDEACFATPSQRICGFFHLGGGQPYRVERLAFGQAGDVPLMGDLDAF